MRILFGSLLARHWDESEVLWTQAASALVRDGHQVSAFFAQFREAPQLDRLAMEGVRFYYGSTPPQAAWRRWLSRKRSLRELLAAAFTAEQPDLVVFCQPDVSHGLDEILYCQEHGLPYVIINQLVGPLPHDAAVQQRLDRAYRGARHVWFVSEENRAALTAFLGRDLSQTESIPNAYDCAYQTELPWPNVPSPVSLAMVGNVDASSKGHDLVLGALDTPIWRERKVRVTIFGRGPDETALLTECQRRGLKQIYFAGHVASTMSIWRSHHALLLPSRYEGQSLAMLEAMLHGRPVIATPVGGTAGLVVDGKSGFLAASADARGFADALERAWHQLATWPEMGAAAAARARGHVVPDSGGAMAARILKHATPAILLS